MRVLIVGAGAVGQVYGLCLARGGAEVSFLVKPRYAEAARAGFTLYRLSWRRAPERLRLEGCGALTSADELARERFDQVWLAVSSSALRGAWRSTTLRAAGDAAVVSLTPGFEDRALLLEDVPAERLVLGLIPFIAYQAPLCGETRFSDEGIAFWLPPYPPTLFAGAGARAPVDDAIGALRAGGMRARREERLEELSGFPTAVMMPHLVALERCGWSFAALRKSPLLDDAARAAREACAVVAAAVGRRPPLMFSLVRPAALRAATHLMPHLVPLPLESYLAHHFTKVGEQTRLFLESYTRSGRELGLPVAALERLARAATS